MTLILNNEEIEQLLSMELCLDVLQDLYREYGHGKTVDIPRCDAIVPSESDHTVYALKTMSGCVPYFGKAAIRLNSDTIHHPTIDGIQRRVKVPKASGGKWVGLVLLFDMSNGEPVAIFPDGIIQRMRVGATNGLAARYLSRKDSKIMALIGSGWQAGSQAMAFCAARSLEEVRVYSPNEDHRKSFCQEMGPKLKVQMVPVKSAEAAVEGADIIAAATSSMIPVLKKEWLISGVHVSGIKTQEITWEIVSHCDAFFLHTNSVLKQKNYYMRGGKGEYPELEKGWWVEKANEILEDKILPDLGDLVTGRVAGRTHPKQITGFLNNLGLGIQFAAVGAKVYEMALEKGLGREIPTDWFLETVHP
ncbi:MAG: ornithine cyclodeaminase family protein [Thermodesulfobacteriota bacterium]|nr:ornithine cyclodeaminase family protein [Thermodesulfobacteriota bacterium]